MLNPKTVERLKEAARRTTWQELVIGSATIIDDYAGGNIDDAYDHGQEDGETILAREILLELEINWH